MITVSFVCKNGHKQCKQFNIPKQLAKYSTVISSTKKITKLVVPIDHVEVDVHIINEIGKFYNMLSSLKQKKNEFILDYIKQKIKQTDLTNIQTLTHVMKFVDMNKYIKAYMMLTQNKQVDIVKENIMTAHKNILKKLNTDSNNKILQKHFQIMNKITNNQYETGNTFKGTGTFIVEGTLTPDTETPSDEGEGTLGPIRDEDILTPIGGDEGTLTPMGGDDGTLTPLREDENTLTPEETSMRYTNYRKYIDEQENLINSLNTGFYQKNNLFTQEIKINNKVAKVCCKEGNNEEKEEESKGKEKQHNTSFKYLSSDDFINPEIESVIKKK